MKFTSFLARVQHPGTVRFFSLTMPSSFHTILTPCITRSMDAANLLKPMLARGELRCIGATTVEEYRKYVEKVTQRSHQTILTQLRCFSHVRVRAQDPAFERRFQQVLVKEPSVPDSISILRGLKQRYENHHGVRILDSALVMAATYANRYIQNRFLPDKAIDLVDEACASTRVQMDSQPEIIDQLERRELQLDVEATALEQEKDEASKVRLRNVREELTKLREQLRPLRMQYEAEKSRVGDLQTLKKKLETIIQKMNSAERDKNLALAADLRFGAIPELEKKIKATEQQLEKDEQEGKHKDSLLSETVTPEKIAEIVSRWTGIPVTKLNLSERQRLLRLGDQLHKRVVGQEEAVDAVAEAVLRSRAGLARTNQPTGRQAFP
jgi:ATP-dependent Clp protease ATP-binding subunit ClpB